MPTGPHAHALHSGQSVAVAVFIALTGIGFVICAGTGLICAAAGDVPPGPVGSSFLDPANIRLHWRGAVRIGLTMMAVGIVGQLVAAVLGWEA